MGRMREATITMAVLLLTTTLMLVLLHTLRIIVDEALEWKIITYISYSICVWGVIAEIVLICAAQKRKEKLMFTWVIMAGVRAFCHCTIATMMLTGEQSYPTVIISCYMYAFSLALALAAWRACLFTRLLRSGKGEVDDYGYTARTKPFSERVARLMPLAQRHTSVRLEDAQRLPAAPVETRRSLPFRKQRDASTTTTVESASSMEPDDSASSTHSSYTDEVKLEVTSSNESSPTPMVHVPPRVIHGPPKQRRHPTESRKAILPSSPPPSDSPSVKPRSAIKRDSGKALATPSKTTAMVQHKPNVRTIPHEPILRNKPVPRRYSKAGTLSNMNIPDSENAPILAAFLSGLESLPRQEMTPSSVKSETSTIHKDESLKSLSSQLDILHRLSKHASQDKVNTEFDEVKSSLLNSKLFRTFKDSLSSTKTSTSQSDPEDTDQDLKLPDNSDNKLKLQVSQGKICDTIASSEEKSFVPLTRSKVFESKVLHDRVSEEDRISHGEHVNLECSQDTEREQSLTKVSQNKNSLRKSEKKSTSSDSKLSEHKGRSSSAGRMRTTSERSKSTGKSFVSTHKRESTAAKKNTSQESELDGSPFNTISPRRESPSHLGDTSSATPTFQHSDASLIPDKRKIKSKVSSAKVERDVSTEKHDANLKDQITEQITSSIRGILKRPEFERESLPRNMEPLRIIREPRPSLRARPLTRIPSKSKSPIRISRRIREKNPESLAAHGLTPILTNKKKSPKYPPTPGMHMIDNRRRSRSRQMRPLSDAEEDSLTTFEATQVRAAIRVASRQRQLQLQEAAAAAAATAGGKMGADPMRKGEGRGVAKARRKK